LLLVVLLPNVLPLIILFYFTTLAVYFITIVTITTITVSVFITVTVIIFTAITVTTITAIIAITTVIGCRTLEDNILGEGGMWWYKLVVV